MRRLMNGDALRNHIVVCGFGHVGSRIAEHLRSRGCEVSVIEVSLTDTARRRADELGCHLAQGDARDEAALELAGVREAKAVLVVTGDDCANLEAAIASKTMNPNVVVVVRLYDRSLGRSVESAFGIRALSASFLAAPAFVAAATDESIVSSLNVDGCRLVFSRDCHERPAGQAAKVIRSGANLAISGPGTTGEDLSDCMYVSAEMDGGKRAPRNKPRSRTRTFGARLKRCLIALSPARLAKGAAKIWSATSAVTRSVLVGLLAVGAVSVGVFSYFADMSPVDALYFVVTTMTTVGYGDFNLQHSSVYLKLFGVLVMLCGAGLLATVYAIIADHVLTARVEYLLGRRQVNLSGHTVLVGLGKVGYRVARELHALGVSLVAIEANEHGDNVEAARTLVPVIIGDASKGAIIAKSGIKDAAAVLALTDDPMLNLSIALEAKEANPTVRTVIRVWDTAMAEHFKSFGLDEVISTSAIASPAFADAAMYPGVQGSFEWGDDDVLVALRHIDESSPHIGKTAAELGTKLGAAVVLSAPASSSDYHPLAPDSPLSAGTKVIVLCTRPGAESAEARWSGESA